VKTLAIRSTMEEMMVSRRATLQSQAEKVSRNWAEESGMRQFIAVSRGHRLREMYSKLFGIEPDILGTRRDRRKSNQVGRSVDSCAGESVGPGCGFGGCVSVGGGRWGGCQADINGRKRCGALAISSIRGIA
jgi:hypothetical protein